jgi:hypothetical protein
VFSFLKSMISEFDMTANMGRTRRVGIDHVLAGCKVQFLGKRRRNLIWCFTRQCTGL